LSGGVLSPMLLPHPVHTPLAFLASPEQTMNLNDFLFASHPILHTQLISKLNRRGDAQRRKANRLTRQTVSNEQRIESLEEDLGYLTLVLGSMLEKLDEQGTLARSEVRALMDELDDLDGVKDGRLDVTVLKEIDALED